MKLMARKPFCNPLEVRMVDTEFVRDEKTITQYPPHDQMKILEAKNIFTQFPRHFFRDYESIANVIRGGDNTDTPVENSDFLHALILTDLMMNHTTKSFRMITGPSGDEFLECLKPSFEKMLRNLSKTAGLARIIFLRTQNDNADAGALANMTERLPQLKTLRVTIKPEARFGHFIVCDEEMLRDEEPHPSLTDDSLANTVKAKVYFKNVSRARVAAAKFDQLWRVWEGA